MPRRMSESAGWIWTAVLGQRWALPQVMVATALSHVLGLAIAIFLMAVYDRVLPAGATGSLVALGAGVALAVGFDTALRLLRARIADAAGLAVEREATLALAGALSGTLGAGMAPPAREEALGALAEAEARRDGLGAALMLAAGDLPFVALYLCAIWLVAGPVVVVPILALAAVAALAIGLGGRIRGLAAADAAAGQRRRRLLGDLAAGAETLRAMAGGAALRGAIARLADEQFGRRAALRARVQTVVQGGHLAQQAAQVGVVLWGALLVIDARLSGGDLIAAVLLTARALGPAQSVAQLAGQILAARARATPATPSLAAPSLAAPALAAARAVPPRVAGPADTLAAPDFALELRGVAWGAPGAAAPVLRAISLRVAPGERIALTGPAGAGKSVLLRLIAGLEPPAEGRVLVDGTDLGRHDPLRLGRHAGVVLDPLWLPAGTLREVIAAGRPWIEGAALWRAAEIAGLGGLFDADPRGWDRPIEAGGRDLSAGQRRALGLARALAGGPGLLLLDDPTAALDPRAEAALALALDRGAGGATMVIVTHRPAMMRICDRVVVLDQGRITADLAPETYLARAGAAEAATPAPAVRTGRRAHAV